MPFGYCLPRFTCLLLSLTFLRAAGEQPRIGVREATDWIRKAGSTTGRECPHFRLLLLCYLRLHMCQVGAGDVK